MYTKTNINQTIILVISAVVILIIGLLLGQGISNKTTAELVGKLTLQNNSDLRTRTLGEVGGGDPADNIIGRLSEIICQKLEDIKNPAFEPSLRRLEDANPPVKPEEPRKTLIEYCAELGYDVD